MAFAGLGRDASIEGFDYVERDVLPLFNVKDTSWFFWDGGSDSLEHAVLIHGQMLAPSKHSPLSLVRLISKDYKDTYAKIWGAFPAELLSWLQENGAKIQHATYRKLSFKVPVGFSSMWNSYRDGFAESPKSWNEAFDGIKPDSVKQQIREVYKNVGIALAEYLRANRLEPSAFDRFVDRAQSGGLIMTKLGQGFSSNALNGYKLFTGRALCSSCHSGPYFTDGKFHNTGLARSARKSLGRSQGVILCSSDPECRAITTPSSQKELGWQLGRHRTPSLRNLALTGPYLHDGSYNDVTELLSAYSEGFHLGLGEGDERIKDIALSSKDIDDLIAFLETLNSSVLESKP